MRSLVGVNFYLSDHSFPRNTVYCSTDYTICPSCGPGSIAGHDGVFKGICTIVREIHFGCKKPEHANAPNDSLGRSLARAFARSGVRSLGRSLARAFARSRVRSLGRSLAREFARSGVRSLSENIALSGSGLILVQYTIWMQIYQHVWQTRTKHRCSPTNCGRLI